MRNASRLCLAAALCVSASAHAEIAFGLTEGSRLIRFDTANVAGRADVAAITGVVAGQSLKAIDFRPADARLYAVSTNTAGTAGQLYTINLATGAATAIGAGFALAGNTGPNNSRVSIDFNPVVNALRVVTGGGQSYRVNANNGSLIAQDGNIVTAGTGATPLISGIAYSNNVGNATSTTLYGYDFNLDNLGTINPPNTGTFNIVGNSGVVTGDAGAGFDISGATGIGYFSVDDLFSPGAGDEFYRVNLATGAFTQIGANEVFSGAFNLLDFSIEVPTPGSLALAVAALGLLASTRRRQPVATMAAA
jgi:MYXO-CTERM domain-containing protein